MAEPKRPKDGPQERVLETLPPSRCVLPSSDRLDLLESPT